MNDAPTPWWRNRAKLSFVVFLAVAGYFLWTEHQAHVIEFLPWILILGCVGMHLFMHGGHGHSIGRNHGDHRAAGQRDSTEGGKER